MLDVSGDWDLNPAPSSHYSNHQASLMTCCVLHFDWKVSNVKIENHAINNQHLLISIVVDVDAVLKKALILLHSECTH